MKQWMAILIIILFCAFLSVIVIDGAKTKQALEEKKKYREALLDSNVTAAYTYITLKEKEQKMYVNCMTGGPCNPKVGMNLVNSIDSLGKECERRSRLLGSIKQK